MPCRLSWNHQETNMKAMMMYNTHARLPDPWAILRTVGQPKRIKAIPRPKVNESKTAMRTKNGNCCGVGTGQSELIGQIVGARKKLEHRIVKLSGASRHTHES